MQEHFLVRKLVLIHLKALKISILRGIFRVFLARQNFSLSEYLEGYPRQMLLGMRCSQALQVQATPGICQLNFNENVFQFTAVSFRCIGSMFRTS